MPRARLYLFALAVLSAVSLRADAPDPAKLKPQGYLNDFANAVDPASRSAILQYCGQFERATKVQIALVTIPTLGDAAIEDWSNKLFHNWGVGQKGSSEGVMMLLVINDKKSRIEVGYGLEQYLTDGIVGSILRDVRPQLQAGNYGAALYQATRQMGDVIAKGKGIAFSPLNPNAGFSRAPPRPYRQAPAIPFPLIMMGLVLIAWVASKFMQGPPGGPPGYRRGGGPGIFWGGGGFGGFGGGGGWGGGGGGGDSGGGFGGFGGGDSGGGGASGGW
ncbi:MAG TPA: TPM domain-containing protein [Bryobacteraceae bacterium]|jgi:uncharacterized protein